MHLAGHGKQPNLLRHTSGGRVVDVQHPGLIGEKGEAVVGSQEPDAVGQRTCADVDGVKRIGDIHHPDRVVLPVDVEPIIMDAHHGGVLGRAEEADPCQVACGSP